MPKATRKITRSTDRPPSDVLATLVERARSADAYACADHAPPTEPPCRVASGVVARDRHLGRIVLPII